ncbi:hypothetical protein Bca101_008294 [Brassica carinata]
MVRFQSNLWEEDKERAKTNLDRTSHNNETRNDRYQIGSGGTNKAESKFEDQYLTIIIAYHDLHVRSKASQSK